jgi:MFS transporter, YNFM family, putative membrane transport protein
MASLAPARGTGARVLFALIGFLTLADLFATQAILPALAARYSVGAGTIGVAANAGTIGMAIAGLLAGVLASEVDRRRGIWAALALLALPTLLLAIAPNLWTFALLRVAQGLCMATAFTLTITYVAEHFTPEEATAALAAYVTGVVASNLVGRLIAATVASTAGLPASFALFALLNLVGALVTRFALASGAPMMQPRCDHFWSAWVAHLQTPALRRAFAVGFLILFGFIGVFTYVGFVLAAPPFALSMRALGLVFLCFAPSLVTTPLAGQAARRLGTPRALPLSLALAIAGLALAALPSLAALILGLALVAIGTFFAQALATASVGRIATRDKAAASGLYLCCYYLGGLIGAVAVGALFDAGGWHAALAAVALALGLAAWLGAGLKPATDG